MDVSQLPNDETARCSGIPCAAFLPGIGNAGAAATADGLPEAIAAIWTKLVGQGVASLGCDFSEGGLREILVVMAELGRAACPAPDVVRRRLQISRFAGCSAEAAAGLLEKLARRHSADCVSFGGAIPTRNTGSIRVANGSASGLLPVRRGCASCTHLVVPVDGSELAVGRPAEPGVELEPTRAMGAWGLYQVRLNARRSPYTYITHTRDLHMPSGEDGSR